MPSQAGVDPTIAEADRRAERAKQSLLERVELLKHKLTEVKHKLDVPSQIAKHPWPALGVAFALGVAAGFGKSGSHGVEVKRSWGGRHEREKRTMRGVVLAAATTLGLRLVREAVLGQLGDLARQWLTAHTPVGQGPASEVRTDEPAAVEPFLEH